MGQKFKHVAELLSDKPSEQNIVIMKVLRRHLLDTLPELGLQQQLSKERSASSTEHITPKPTESSNTCSTDCPPLQMFGGCKCVSLKKLGLQRGNHQSNITWFVLNMLIVLLLLLLCLILLLPSLLPLSLPLLMLPLLVSLLSLPLVPHPHVPHRYVPHATHVPHVPHASR